MRAVRMPTLASARCAIADPVLANTGRLALAGFGGGAKGRDGCKTPADGCLRGRRCGCVRDCGRVRPEGATGDQGP